MRCRRTHASFFLLCFLAVAPAPAQDACDGVGLPAWIANAEDNVWAMKNNVLCLGEDATCGMCTGFLNLADLNLYQAVIGFPVEPDGTVRDDVPLTCDERLVLAAAADGLADEVNTTCGFGTDRWYTNPPCDPVGYEPGEMLPATCLSCSDPCIPCEILTTIPDREVRPGDTLRFGWMMKHNRPTTVVSVQRVSIQDERGKRVWTKLYPPSTFQQGDVLETRDQVVIDERAAPGTYRLVLEFRGMLGSTFKIELFDVVP